MAVQHWCGAFGGVALAIACSSSSKKSTSDAPAWDAPADAVIVDAPPTISTGDPNMAVTCLVADATSVYWSSGFQPSYVWKAPLTGGSATLLATDQVENACVKAVDSTNVYYADGQGTVNVVPVGGGSSQSRGPSWLGDLTTNGQYLIQGWYNSGTELWITPVADGSAMAWTQFIGIYSLSNLASDPTYTYLTGEATVSGPFSIARAAIGSDYNPTIETLFSAPTGYVLGGGSAPTYPSQIPTAPYVLDAQNLYIVQQSTSTGATQIVQRPITGSAAPIVLVDNQSGLVALAVDSTHVYWSALNGSAAAAIQRVPIGGGSVATVATATSGHFALAPARIAWTVAGYIDVLTLP